jgi:YVTN family beta-propeller protein
MPPPWAVVGRRGHGLFGLSSLLPKKASHYNSFSRNKFQVGAFQVSGEVMIRTPKALWLALFTAILIVIATGCNDTLRQFITPVPGPGGDPGTLSHAVVLSTNSIVPSDGSPAVGSTLHIDVSGDTVAGVVNVGPKPVFLGKGPNRVFVLNGDDTASTYTALLPLSSAIFTVTLPPGTSGQAAGFSNSGNLFVTSPSDKVDVIASAVLAFTTALPVGTNPVSIAGNGNNSKIYVVNQGSGDVTVISTIDNFVFPQAIPLADAAGHPGQAPNPIWGVMAPDGVHVFVVNQGDGTHTGWVSVIDTFLDQVIANVPVGVSPNYAVFEPRLQRVYVSNTGDSTVSVIKANGINLAQQIVPTNIGNIAVPAGLTSVAALADGSRVYAAIGGCLAGTNHINLVSRLANCSGNQVAIIDATSFAVKKVLTVGAGAVSIDAANDSSRVYVVGANAGNVSIIRTSDDAVLTTIPAPQQSLGCQSKVVCPGTATETPFMVRVFP